MIEHDDAMGTRHAGQQLLAFALEDAFHGSTVTDVLHRTGELHQFEAVSLQGELFHTGSPVGDLDRALFEPHGGAVIVDQIHHRLVRLWQGEAQSCRYQVGSGIGFVGFLVVSHGEEALQTQCFDIGNDADQ
ncbi:hypothetical protein D9M70_630610 [compost metagenome]